MIKKLNKWFLGKLLLLGYSKVKVFGNNIAPLFIGLVVVTAISCSDSSKKSTDSLNKRKYVVESNPVDIMVLKSSVFSKELVSNGKLIALRKSILKFRVSDKLEKLWVKNGVKVKKGKTIASLNTFRQDQALDKARIRFDRIKYDLKDHCVRQGYFDENDLKITPQVMKSAKILVGYYTAENDLKTAQNNLDGTTLIAPFSGTIANLTKKEFEMVGTQEAFCTLIDENIFEVEFEVLETEISQIEVGKKVKIIPFSFPAVCYGEISEINPVVDKNGLVKIMAQVKNPGKFMEGMNVKVLVESKIPNRLVVPKSAVLLRDNKEVVFTIKHGKAFWTYVKVTEENSSSYSVIGDPNKSASLEPNDTVIISGNLNLAHESSVVF